MKDIFLVFIFLLFCPFSALAAIPSCSEVSYNYQTEQYSLDYCNQACSGSCAIHSAPDCDNYCVDDCCSYCICDPCGDVSPSPAEQCGGSESNVVKDSSSTDSSSCDFHCRCPDYAGQTDYNFDTCEDSGPCAAVGKDPVSECGGIENIEWQNVDTCEYSCKDDPCSDEYQAALLECATPYLVDSLTCEYTCTCEEKRNEADSVCTEGYFISDVTCEYSCKCCDDKINDCIVQCGGADNVQDSTDFCSDHTDVDTQQCIVDTYNCKCIVPPVEDPDPNPDPPEGPEPDPDPGVDPDNPDGKTCEELKAQTVCDSPCVWRCSIGSDGLALPGANCDCGEDPENPDNPDDPEGADDGANGWLKQIEENTDRTANEVSEGNSWLKAIKSNTDKIVENTSNIAGNVKVGIDNDKEYFIDGSGRSVFKDRSGKSYLETIAGKDFSSDVSVDVGEIVFPDITVDVGEFVLPLANEYSSSLDEIGENGDRVLGPLPESTFETDLTNYIASGIPLFDYIKNTSINLSSASPVLSLNILGQPVSVDYSRYESSINKAGDILFYLTVLSCFILIITRAKG